jgi:hypothetical protein
MRVSLVALFAVALLSGCPAPSGFTSCLTASDCASGETCVAGGCVEVTTDAAASDGGASDGATSDAGIDAAAPDAGRTCDDMSPCPTGFTCGADRACIPSAIDAGMPIDAFTADASAPVDASGIDASCAIGPRMCADAAPTDASGVDAAGDAGVLRGDRCSLPIEISLGSTIIGSATADLGTFANDYQTSCGDAGGRDVVFHFTLPTAPGGGVAPSDVDILVTDGRSPDTLIGIGYTCDEAAGNAGIEDCDDDRDEGIVSNPHVILHRPQHADVFVLVDGVDASQTGMIRIDVSVRAARSDICGPEALDITDGAMVLGYVGASTDTPLGTCAPSTVPTGRAAYFRIQHPPAVIQSITAWTPSPASMSLRSSCAMGSTDIACSPPDAMEGTSFTDVSTGIGSGDRYLTLHGFAASDHDYTLEYDP